MVNQAMKAARGDVRGREIEPTRRRSQPKRSMDGRRAMFTQWHSRSAYRGTTRSRDTQVMPGHELGGLWHRWIEATRSSKPAVRRLAHKRMAASARTYPVAVAG
jgi:hypothetical protein